MPADSKATLVFVPYPIMSHLVSAVATAKLLAVRDDRLSITILIMKMPVDTKISSYTKIPPHPRINFVHLQENKSDSPELVGSKHRIVRFLESQTGPVREAVAEMMESRGTGKLAGLVLDMFCTPLIGVAKELGAPAYIFFPSSSAALGLVLHLQSLHDNYGWDMKEYTEDSDLVVSVPAYVNPVPARVWPAKMFDDERGLLDFARGFRECKGIVMNTFLEFESHAIASLSSDERIPPVYPVGPMIQGGGEESEDNKRKREEIIEWLNEQPDSSVVFLCFGTNGSFKSDQVEEIATALEKSGVRFLWSLRKPPPEESREFPGEYESPEEVLPEGFLERTAGVGKVIGWAPQVAVLSHPSVGGFVSHCGWNSTLESVWTGVPMATWPLFAEQQVNAFQVVKDFEMAVEIKMDYRKSSDVIVDAETIEMAIRELMEPENKIRAKVKELHEKSRTALVEGGSSYNSVGRLIEDIMDNIS